MKKWTQDEKDILLKHYAEIGAIGCSKLLARRQRAICKKARKMGLSTKKTFGGGIFKKLIISKINDQKGVVVCDKHGETEHYLSPSGSPRCLICRRMCNKIHSNKPEARLKRNLAQRERYKKPEHNYANRLRRTLRFYSSGEISFSKHLPYSSKQLCNHLESIRKIQNNKCPMCSIDYDTSNYDIDHVLPVSIATNIEDILHLFALDNLSLLCPACNRCTKRDLDRKKYDGGVRICL